MAFSLKETQYKNFGKVLILSDGVTEAYVTLDFGPRVIRYGFVNGENFMFEDVDGTIVEKGKKLDEYFYPGAYWRTYGGHRIWLTPESMPETYYPDNDPVTYDHYGQTVVFIPPPQKSNLVQERLILTYQNDGSLEVAAEATNIADKAQSFGIWQISVMCQNGLAVAPQNVNNTVLLHNRTMSLWPYCDMSDGRVTWGKTLISLRQDPDATGPFKVGLSNSRGFVSYLCHGALFTKRFDRLDGVTYPDDGCNFEMYTNPHFLELESLGKLAPVAPGETIRQAERWSLTGGVEAPCGKDMAALEKIVASCIES